MDFSNVLHDFVDNFQNNSSESICYITLPDSSPDAMPDIVNHNFTVVNLENDFSPFKPFLKIISSFSPDENVVSEKTYSLQKNTFLSYFKNGIADERYDFISTDEVFYERDRYAKTIIDLLLAIGEKKTPDKKQRCFFILNAQYLCDNTIEILNRLEKVDLHLKFIFCFDARKLGNAAQTLVSFFSKLNNKGNYFDFTAGNIQSHFIPNKKIDSEILFNFDFLHASLKNLRLFLSLEQGRILAKWIEANENALDFSDLQKRDVYIEVGLIYYYSKMYDEAEFFLHNVLDIQCADEQYFIINIFLANIFRYENYDENALKYIRSALRLFHNQKDSPLYAIALMTEHLISSRSDTISYEKYNAALSSLEKCGLLNSYINTMLVVPWSFLQDKTLMDTIRKNIVNGYKLANEIGNKFALSTVCHWCGILATHDGKTDDALEWYDECNIIRTEIGDLNSIVKIRNGLSYDSLLNSMYKKAYDLINSFISHLPQMNDYSEIILTLNNVAQTLFYSRHFDKASLLFQKALYFMHIFGIKKNSSNSLLPSYNDIFIYKTFIDLYNGDIIRAKINYNNITNNDLGLSMAGKTILSLINAVLLLKEENLAGSIETFEKCTGNFFPSGKGLEHLLVFIEYEYAIILDSSGYKKEGEKYFKNGFKLAQENNLEYFTKNKTYITYSDYIYGVQDFEPLNVDLNYMQEKIEKDKLLNQLQGRLQSYQFLNRIMTYGLEGNNIRNFGRNVLNAIFDYTTADAAFIAEKQNGYWTLIHNVNRTEQNVPDKEVWDSLFGASEHFKTTMLVYDKENNFYYSDISRFEFIGGIIIFPSKPNKLSPYTINTLNIALSTIQAQLVMLRQNDHLLYISSTDYLSQLNNHRALQDYIDRESQRLMIQKQNRDELQKFTVVFLDLDNFKFYNDTYGHEAGDLFISCFASLLRKHIKDEYFFSRFGGDEFVCILPNSDYNDAKKFTDSLYTELETEHHFIPRLETFLDKKLDIGAEHFLSFSAGVCTNGDLDTNESCDLNATMSYADKALYYSKRHGRKRVSYWNDIKSENSHADMAQNSKYLSMDKN